MSETVLRTRNLPRLPSRKFSALSSGIEMGKYTPWKKTYFLTTEEKGGATAQSGKMESSGDGWWVHSNGTVLDAVEPYASKWLKW